MSKRSVGRYIAVLVAVVLLVSAGVHFARVRHDIGSQRYDDMGKDGTATQYADLGGPDDRRLEPVDEASQNPGFIEFRDQLLAAAYEKDVDFLRKHTDDSIRYTFGVNRGISGFFEEWNLDTHPDESMFWNELIQVLVLGGTFNNDENASFIAPYVYSRFPEDIDWFQHVAIIDENVRVYDQPDFNSKVKGTLTYSIVRVLDADAPGDSKMGKGMDSSWQKIQTLSGHSGFISARYARSPIDYRANWRNIDGVWKLIFFVAGD